jgi:hypothetical protein
MTTKATPGNVPLSDQLGRANEAQPLVERLRTRPTGDPYLHMMVHEAADMIALLWNALDLVRHHPEFDDGGPMAEMMDQVLAGQPAPMLAAVADIQRRYVA